MPASTRVALALGVILAGLLGLAGTAGQPVASGPTLGLLALGVVGAELMAVPTGSQGYFSAAFSFVLAATLLAPGGFRAALLLFAPAVALRALLGPGRRRFDDALWQSLVVLAAAAVGARVALIPHPLAGPAAGLGAALAFVALFLTLPGGPPAALRDQLLPQALGVALLGVLMPVWLQPLSLLSLLTLPLAGAIAVSAANVVVVREERDKLELELELKQTRQVAEAAGARAADLGRELGRSHQEKRSLQAWGEGLAVLLSAFQELAGTLDQEQLLDRLRGRIQELLSPTDCTIALEAEATPEALRSTSGPTRLGPGRVGVALRDERGVVGAVLITGVFDEAQLDLLHALALEAAIALANCRLHAQVRQAHDDFRRAQAQLFQSSKLAAVGQLASGVAHEMNTPLGAIHMALEWLQLKSRDEGMTAKLATALRASERLQAIIDRLLDYSRTSSHQAGSVAVGQLLSDTLELVGTHLRHARIELIREVPEGLTVFVNANELQQVLTNLLLNARDALADQAESGRRVRVRAQAADDRVLVEVSDSGPGPLAEARGRLFEPFFTTKPAGQGTGLGLSLSRDLCRQNGGELEFLEGSAETTFRLSLPSRP